MVDETVMHYDGSCAGDTISISFFRWGLPNILELAPPQADFGRRYQSQVREKSSELSLPLLRPALFHGLTQFL
jgi:hypothetical protein